MKFSWLSGKKISIWGTANYGRDAFVNLSPVTEILGFYDSNYAKWGEEFADGIKVRQWIPREMEKNEFIVLASDYYAEIIPDLLSFGLKPFLDFIPYVFFKVEYIGYEMISNFIKLSNNWEGSYQYFLQGKQLAIFFGNFQMDNLQRIMALDDEYSEKYETILTPSIEFINSPYKYESEIIRKFIADTDIIKSADLFFYQITDSYDILEEVRANLKDNCVQISVPKLDFYGYFPQIVCVDDYIEKKVVLKSIYRDIFIEEFMKQFKDNEEDIDKKCNQILNGNFLDDEKIRRWMTDCIETLKILEQEADIKISDFIEENCYKQQLYTSPMNPVYLVYLELAKRCLRKIENLALSADSLLNISNYHLLSDNYMVTEKQGCVIYPCVKSAIELEDTVDIVIERNIYGQLKYSSYETFIRNYILGVI